ncbi:MAG: plastocyanin/azurin family copper-binding protein [Leadbetterella sp.]
MKKIKNTIYILVLSLVLGNFSLTGQTKVFTEDDYYKIITVPIPDDVKLEVGGMAVIPDGRLAVCTRRGDVYMINNPYSFNGSMPAYKKFASGLHEPLGLGFIDGKLCATQRGEVTILDDIDQDGVADSYKALYKFPLSGNYHQYSYGPLPSKKGDYLFTLNLDWIGYGASQSKWRGWMLRIDKNGNMTPFAMGLRSPSGFLENTAGDIFYSENQGDWVGSGRITHLEKGDMAGNPMSLDWSGEQDSPTKLKRSDIPDTGEPMYEVAKRVKGIKPPAVWFPHTIMGISTSDIIEDESNGKFGPFAGQYFVGDQGHSKVMRMYLEKVNGVYQGACFPFKEGFQSGILRMKWGIDNSMFVGMTSRGWASTGKDLYGLQRLEWTGKTPFEIKSIQSMSDGFKIEFTQKASIESLKDVKNYALKSFTYKYHHNYGSPVINSETLPVKAISVSDDGLSVRISIDNIRLGYVHEVNLDGIKSLEGLDLLHSTGYYTLNQINTNGNSPVDRNQYGVKQESAQVMDHSMHSTIKATNSITAKRTTEIPADWNGQIDQTLTIGTKPGLKFSVSKLQVKAGSKIKLVFNNNDDMLHNLLIVKPGTVTKVGEEAFKLGTEGEAKAFVPSLEEVVYHTGLLQPESSESIYFKAPEEPGDYTFVCTFPGHYTLMQGILKVRK